MLPGFRFLFAAIVLSISMLIFGLGAAALLRGGRQAQRDNEQDCRSSRTPFSSQ